MHISNHERNTPQSIKLVDTDLNRKEQKSKVTNENCSTIGELFSDVLHSSVPKSKNFYLSEQNQASRYSKLVSDEPDPDSEINISNHQEVIQTIQPYYEDNTSKASTVYYKKTHDSKEKVYDQQKSPKEEITQRQDETNRSHPKKGRIDTKSDKYKLASPRRTTYHTVYIIHLS